MSESGHKHRETHWTFMQSFVDIPCATSSGIPCGGNMGLKVFTIEAQVLLLNLAISTNANM